MKTTSESLWKTPAYLGPKRERLDYSFSAWQEMIEAYSDMTFNTVILASVNLAVRTADAFKSTATTILGNFHDQTFDS